MTAEIIFAYVSATAAVIGSGLYFKAKLEDTVKTLAAHLLTDAAMHTLMTDRLARIETKIDGLMERNQ